MPPTGIFAIRRYMSYWMLPVLASLVWFSTVLALLLYWLFGPERRPHYPSMEPGQYVAYISDVGASTLKPLFVVGCCVSAVLLDASFLADRWLRHKGRLVPNSTTGEKILSYLTIVFAVVGTVGLCLLSGFDTVRYPTHHDLFLLLFMAGYVLSAIFICWEYQRLGSGNRDHRVLRVSFWIKLAFILVAVALAAAFAGLTRTRHYNEGAIMEWTIAFFFTLYISSFYVDLYPAIYTKPGADALRHPKRPDLGQPRRLEAGGDASASEELVDVYVGPAAMAEHRRRSQTPIWAQAPVTIGVARDGRLTQDSQRTLPVGLDLGRPATPKPARTPID